ncbi:MAG TPA: metallophosphoesterase [Clostridia bacterium]|nr:metallophosphoesterase [Clostridia bacterium]
MNVRITGFVFAMLAALLCTAVAAEQPAAKAEPFTFVQLCDPQIGFKDYAVELKRLQQAVARINQERPDFVVICGDLVNTADEKSFADFNEAMNRLAVPVHCAPGNHDVGNKPTEVTLARYRKAIGKDYYSFEHKGRLFVVANSQLWKSPLPGESEKHNAWFKEELERAAKKQQPVFVICHYLPFEKTHDEPEAYFNLPLDKRQELLGLFHRYGVVAVLAGHTHKTLLLDHAGIQFVSSETTSVNFDQRPYGFRCWHVGTQRPFQHEFVPLVDAPK